MYYIVGLGNPGEKYTNTRHNVGFAVLDALIEQASLPLAVTSSKYAGRVSEGVLAGVEVMLLYPETFMNNSGSAVRKMVPSGGIAQLIVIYDDVDLPVGTVKVAVGKGSGGHNGVASIISSLGSKEFIRVRVGIAGKTLFGKTKRPTGARLADHVLGDFKKREQTGLDASLSAAVSAVTTIVRDGVVAAMNTYNQ